MSTDPKAPFEPSTPDLEVLDSAWEGDDGLDDVDDGWETVPDPAGGPPIRRRLSPKERARLKREKHRLRADAAAKKQKGKKAKKHGLDGRTLPPSAPPPALAGDSDEPTASPTTTAAAPRGAAKRTPPRSKRLDARGIAMIVAALVLAAGALYAMMASRH